jgi:hypothetical protein
MSSTINFPSLSSSDTPHLKFHQYLDDLVDAAVTATHRPDGLAGYLLTPAAFLIRFGHPYVFPAEPAAEPESVPAAPWQTWRYHEDIRIQTTIDLNTFREKFLAGLDRPILQLFKETVGGNRSRTLEWMITRMQQQFGTASSRQLEAHERSLTQPYKNHIFESK